MIFLCGDPHGRFDHVIQAVRVHKPKAIVLLGDLVAEEPLDVMLAPILDLTEVWFIPGNHDTDSDAVFDNLFNSGLAHRNLHGRVVDVAGVRIAGLGGVFRGQVWMPPAEQRFASAAELMTRCGKGNRWRGGLPRKHHSSIFPADYAALACARADVLVSHEAPGAYPYGFIAITELAHKLGARKIFHGHHHDPCVYGDQFGSRQFQVFSVGLRGIVSLDGDVIVRSEE